MFERVELNLIRVEQEGRRTRAVRQERYVVDRWNGD